jgi:signal transduction histidine kinase/CheY-like chemotaxis protein
MPRGAELSASEALDHVLGLNFESILTLDHQGQVSRCNDLARRVYDQGTGCPFRERIHPDDWHLVEAHLKGEARFQVTVRMGRPGGWILGQLTAVPCAVEEAAWIVAWTDVTSATLQSRHHAAFIQAGERFGWMPWTMEREREEARLSPGAYEILFGERVDKPQLVQLSDLLAVLHPFEDGESLVAPMRAAYRSGESFHMQYSVVHPNGQVRWVQSLGVATRDLDGVVHFDGVLRDSTADHHRAVAATHAQHTESVRLMAGGLAHDLNNQLQVIMAHLSLLQEHVSALDSDRLAQAMDSLEWADGAVERARELAGKLLIFSRSAPPSLEPVGIADIIRSSLGVLHQRADIKLEAEWDPDLWSGVGDRIQLLQVLENLVHNAADAMPGGGRLHIRADNRTEPDGMMVAIIVEDSGPGIAPELWDNIFDPYYSTKVNGHGLGLAASQAIMQQHGGQLLVGASALGGAAFTMILPATLESPLDSDVVDEDVGQLAGTALIVDDEPQVRAGAQALAQSYGLTTAVVADGPSALAWLRTHTCDVVVLDWVLGSPMAGHQVLAALQAKYPSVSVVVSSGYADVPIPAGIPTLPKPYTREQMGRALAAILRK